MSFTYPAGILSKTPVTPAGPYAEGAASGVWKLNEVAYWIKQGLWPNANTPTPNDPYFQYVTSLLHGDGTNGGQNNTFLDSSSNAFTITRNGNTTQGSFSPYGSNWGNYFNGTNSYIGLPSNSALQLGSGDFTIETWFYRTTTATTLGPLFDFGWQSSSGWGLYIDDTIQFRIANSDKLQYSPAGLFNQWVHIAITRSGSTLSMFINGNLVKSTTDATNLTNSTAYIGKDNTYSNYYTGYLSNVRLVKGGALYTSNFTPSTTPLTTTVSAGTVSLLTCQSNRFIDNSANTFTETIGGTPQVSRFSPFAPTYSTQYSTSTIGGSGYFDGSGDYLTAPSSSAFNIGANDACVECWVYLTSLPTYQIFNGQNSSTNSTLRMGVWNGYFQYTVNNDTLRSSGIAPTTGQWYHLALTITGGVARYFINGVLRANASGLGNVITLSEPYYIGTEDTNYMFGYMSDFRFTNGSIPTAYQTSSTTNGTSIFTPPTTPLTAVTNTALLCNFTNGAIYDNAEVADYETVGNAQISTSVKKYGTGSLAFDGTGDYLVTRTPDSEFAFGTGNFTIEFWMYYNSTSGIQILYDSRPASTNGAYPTIYQYEGQVIYYANSGDRITSPTLTTGVWYHIAASRAGTSTKLFVNGTQVGSTYSDSTNYIVGANRPIIGAGGDTLGANAFNGYIDDLRVTKGYARYWENFTPPTAALPNFGGAYQVPTQDPQFNYTTMLLPGNGTNGAQNNTFLDSSTNAFTITRNGNTTQGTFTPFSQTGWGTYIPNGSYLQTPSTGQFAPTGDFTVECWFYPTTAMYNYQGIVGQWGGGIGDYWAIEIYSDGHMVFLVNGGGATRVTTGANAVTTGQWYHFALVRSGSTVTAYINGNSQGTTSYSGTFGSASHYVTIGNIAGDYATGYVSNVRLVDGTAVYTANFTPPTTALTAISGTKLLTCQSNRFVDNSSVANTITVSGSPSVQAFSPFAPTAAYSTSVVGGSGYFNGSGDSLQTTNKNLSALSPGTGDFCAEGWIYLTTVPTTTYSTWPVPFNTTMVSGGGGYVNPGDGSDYGILFQYRKDGSNYSFNLVIKENGSSSLDISTTGTSASIQNRWVHWAISRKSGSVAIFINGVRSATGSWSNSIVNTTAAAIFQRNANSSNTDGYLYGYASGVRYVVGSYVYDPDSSTVTIPTAPPTAITNTQLLLNYTNAGIADATAKNDLQTVGNAQISTTQSKFGGSSMYFDGSGDYLTTKGSQNLTFNSGHFTIEGWFYFNNISSSYNLVGNLDADDLSIGLYYYQPDNKLILGTYNYDIAYAVGVLSATTWTHIAATYDGSVYRLFVNGNFVGTTTSTLRTLTNSTNPWQVGALPFLGGRYFNGYMQDVRITKGYARYVQNFTPPTQADQLY